MIVLVMGVTGSGKSTVGQKLAKQLGWEFADADDWHPEANRTKMLAGIPLDDQDRRPWLDALAALAARHESMGKSLVLACSALKHAYRRRLGFVEAISAGSPGGAQESHGRRIVFLAVPAGLSAQRLAGRQGHFMNPDLVASQFATLEEPLGPSVLRLDASQPLSELLAAIRAWLEQPHISVTF